MQKVRFTANNLGLIDPAAPFHGFEPEHVGAGDEGELEGPHPDTALAEVGWQWVHVEVNGRKLICPCHHEHFEKVA